MEKANYRVNLELIQNMFPDRATLSPEECGRVIGCSRNTVYSYMRRAKNPLPCKRLSDHKVIIPIASLANWMS